MLNARDGTRLHYEECGSGTPIIFVHEFGGDWRSWEPQLRYFSRRYRCITFSARGYAPSDVPAGLEHYSQAIATDDIADVLDGLVLAQPATNLGIEPRILVAQQVAQSVWFAFFLQSAGFNAPELLELLLELELDPASSSSPRSRSR